MKILWVSRHDPSEEELKYLESIFGEFDVVQYKPTIRRPDYLGELLNQHNPDRVVAVLPASLQGYLTQELAARDMPPLIRPVYHHRSGVGVTDWVFQGFNEVLHSDIRTVPLQPPT